ncbi:hypothetical protein BOW52_08550 [Solemya elarraichensis gill symbiont]|uniref:Uncharacterized protein n=1 Tax=Solemya elarraichensis gill symbiont TaxID=1918949 RepID=A0A1T2L016_9GAMM|nr:hypothetical protein BOW52_08550 [Solemya elarraichensis gill symbiont]
MSYAADPVIGGRWITQYLGDDVIARLEGLITPMKTSIKSRAIIASHYKAQLESMESLRQEGKAGRLEFYNLNK